MSQPDPLVTGAGPPSQPRQEPAVRWSEAARALGGLSVAERRWYLILRVAMALSVCAFLVGSRLGGLRLDRGSALAVLLLLVPPTILGIELHLRGIFTDGWLLALLLSDIIVLTLGNHWTGGVESSFGYSYLAVVLGSALFLDRRPAVFCAVGSATAYVLLVLLEYAGVVAHRDFLGVALERHPSYLVYECTMKSLVFVMTSLVTTAVVATARRAYSRLEEQERRMRQFAAEALAMQEAESRRIARDLHDGAGQALTAARLHLEAAAKKIAASFAASALADSGPVPTGNATPPVRESVMATVRLLDAAMDEVRRSAAALGPTALDELGLVEGLRRHCDDLAASRRVAVRFSGPDGRNETIRPPAAVERACYRIAQEALTNAIRHGKALHIEVQVLGGDGTLGVEVLDDGCGFDRTRVRRGMGLRGMRDRAALLGGTLTIDTAPGRGTRVRAVLPARPDVDVV